MRVRPASRNANPACMNITRIAAMTTQIVLAAIRRSLFSIAAAIMSAPAAGKAGRSALRRAPSSLRSQDFHLLQAHARSVVHDVVDRRRPDEAVARLVAADRRGRDRRGDGLRL